MPDYYSAENPIVMDEFPSKADEVRLEMIFDRENSKYVFPANCHANSVQTFEMSQNSKAHRLQQITLCVTGNRSKRKMERVFPEVLVFFSVSQCWSYFQLTATQ